MKIEMKWFISSKLIQKEYKTQYRWGGEGDWLGIVQEIKILSYKQMLNAQTGIYLRKWDAENSLKHWDKNKPLNPS